MLTKTLESLLPADTLEDIKADIAIYREEWEDRKFDYYEYNDGTGNDIQRLDRDTAEWQKWNDVWCDDDSDDEDEGIVTFDGHDGPRWYDHLTGEREATYDYPGWRFLTFKDKVHAYILDTLNTNGPDDGEAFEAAIELTENVLEMLFPT